MVASFEFTYADDWRIALWYLDPYESWSPPARTRSATHSARPAVTRGEVETARRTTR